MPTLYVTEAGARIEKEYHRILVTLDDDILMSIPLQQISEIVLVGSVGATTPALLSLLDHGVGLTFIHTSGKLRGRLEPAEQPNLALRHRQYACSQNPQFCLEISRAIVNAKIKNSRTLARRILRQPRWNQDPTKVKQAKNNLWKINEMLAKIPRATSLAELRGLEGLASKQYYAIFRQGLHSDFYFKKRTRRPPKDPTNALLSLSYTLLTQAAITACRICGLDPYDGFYHADKYNRPALALDLIEEFRSVIADSVVLTAVNKRICQAKNFNFPEDPKEGVVLNRAGWRAFLSQFSSRLTTKVVHPLAGRPLSYQKILEIQARQLRKAIESGSPVYTPFLIR